MKKCLSESDGWEMATDGAVIKYQYRVKSRDSGAVLFDSSTTGDCPQTTCGSGELIEVVIGQKIRIVCNLVAGL